LHVFDALLETAASVESSLDLWTLADIFFANFDSEDMTACFEAECKFSLNYESKTQADIGFDVKVAWRLEPFLFRVTEAIAFMVSDVDQEHASECVSEYSNRIFNGIIFASVQPNLLQQ
jgi:hypothetical protein